MNDDRLNPSREQIAAAAYHLYIERGGSAGPEKADWLRAKDLLTREMQRLAALRTMGKSRSSTGRASAVRQSPTKRTPARRVRNTATRGEIREKTSAFRQAPRQPKGSKRA